MGSCSAELPAITCDSLALCSAPYKALRFAAPPAFRGGLRTLTAPARSASRLLRDGRGPRRLLLTCTSAQGLTRGFARRILLLSRRCRTTPPLLRTQVHAERVSGRRSQSTIRRSLDHNLLSRVRRMRLTSDQHQVVHSDASSQRPALPGSTEAFDVSRHMSRTRRGFLTIGWPLVIDHGHRRTD